MKKKGHRLTDFDRAMADPRHARRIRREQLVLDFTEAVIDTMDYQELKRSDLAKRLGWTTHQVSAFLNGRGVTIDKMMAICVALGVKMEIRLEQQ